MSGEALFVDFPITAERAHELADAEFDQALARLILLAKAKFGDGVYEYLKVEHNWSSDTTSKGRTKRTGRYHTTISGPGNSICTKEEYDANVAQGEQDNTDAFMCRKRGGYYYTYRRKVITDGWFEHLVKILADSTG